jgi:Anti-sigma-K factor rskA/Putative zinc-finger
MDVDAHERYEDELAAYMLGSLEPPEVAAFEQHLASCDRCQARERWLRASVEVLPSSVEQIQPPPQLRERLLETVRREAGVQPEAGRPARRRRPQQGVRAWLGSLSLRPAIALAAVALLLAAGVVGYAVGQGGRVSETKTIVAQGSGKGTIVRTGDSGVLSVSNLPQRPGRVYEVWLLKDGKPVPSTLFQVHKDGTGAAGIPDGLDDSTRVMVTSEPSAGSTKPTQMPVLSAPV